MTSKREREQRQERVQRAREYGKQYDVPDQEAGRMSLYASMLDDMLKSGELKPGDAVAAIIRTSTRGQKARGTLERIKIAFAEELSKRGLRPINEDRKIHIHADCCSGKLKDFEKRKETKKALKTARKFSLVTVTICASRYLRTENFDVRYNSQAMPTKNELDAFFKEKEELRGLRFATMIDPDSTPDQDEAVLAEYAKRGIENKRGRKKKGETEKQYRKRTLRPVALRLRREGKTLGGIAKLLGLAKA